MLHTSKIDWLSLFHTSQIITKRYIYIFILTYRVHIYHTTLSFHDTKIRKYKESWEQK